MSRWLVLAVLVGMGLGCENNPPEPAATPQATNGPQTLTLAGTAEPSRIGMVSIQGEVNVGDSWERARAAFPEPRGAYEVHDLPPDFPSQYNAHGWETPTGEGFGTVTLDGKVVMAMYQLERTKDETVRDILSQQRTKLGEADAVITGKSVNYWFWTDPTAKQSLMACELSTRQGINLTLAMGDDSVLDRLGISQVKARNAIYRLDGKQPIFASPPQSEERNAPSNR